MVYILDHPSLPATERIIAGQHLAHLGDDRPGIGLRPDGLPDIIWCNVPAGPFIRGSEERDNEQPQQIIDLPAFKISRYPMTNAQFQAFVVAGGYKVPTYWVEADEADYWQAGQFKGYWDSEPRDYPIDYGQPFNLPNHPVVGVSWYEAVAFCRWLMERIQETGEIGPTAVVQLPSENQWEKAARGRYGLLYPWGVKVDSERTNYAYTGLGATSAVGCFAQGASPYGVEEMSGNVWEWCLTKWQDSYDGYVDDNDFKGDGRPVIRGGAFDSDWLSVRCAARYFYDPDYGGNGFGFRLVVVRAP